MTWQAIPQTNGRMLTSEEDSEVNACGSEQKAFWYAVKSKPRQERLVVSGLERAGIESFFPMIKEWRPAGGRLQMCTSPLFPGYLFAKFDVERDYRTVTYARGVRAIVSFGPVPAVVDEELIEAIKDRIHNGAVHIPQPGFEPGQVVRIQHGPLTGMEAVFQRRIPGYQRAVLLLRAISYQAQLVMDVKDIVNL